MRRCELPDVGPVILADTVGFISHLPHKLVEAFSATLEEAASASLLLHVMDAASAERQRNFDSVMEVRDRGRTQSHFGGLQQDFSITAGPGSTGTKTADPWRSGFPLPAVRAWIC